MQLCVLCFTLKDLHLITSPPLNCSVDTFNMIDCSQFYLQASHPWLSLFFMTTQVKPKTVVDTPPQPKPCKKMYTDKCYRSTCSPLCKYVIVFWHGRRVFEHGGWGVYSSPKPERMTLQGASAAIAVLEGTNRNNMLLLEKGLKTFILFFCFPVFEQASVINKYFFMLSQCQFLHFCLCCYLPSQTQCTISHKLTKWTGIECGNGWRVCHSLQSPTPESRHKHSHFHC